MFGVLFVSLCGGYGVGLKWLLVNGVMMWNMLVFGLCLNGNFLSGLCVMIDVFLVILLFCSVWLR